MSIKKRSDVKIRMKTHKLTLHCRNNDILFLRKDKNSKQACNTIFSLQYFIFVNKIDELLNKDLYK
jgi:hypothetical protein